MKKFKDRFKVGDIIRRGGYIRTGQLMIVESFREAGASNIFEEAFTCVDMFVDDQKWTSSEDGNFALATDEDIVLELTKRVITEEAFIDSFGNVSAEASDEYITLVQGGVVIFLDPSTALQLFNFTNKHVGVK